VAVGVFEEDPIAAADCGLAITVRIPGKTDSGSRIEQVPFHAANRYARCNATLHDAVRQVGQRRWLSIGGKAYDFAGTGIDCGLASNVTRRIEIEGLMLLLAVGAKQADSQPQIKRQAASDVPVVLEVRFQNFVTVIVLDAAV